MSTLVNGEMFNTDVYRSEKLLLIIVRKEKVCAGNRKQFKLFKKLPKLSLSIFSRIPICAPFMPKGLPLCKKIFNLRGELEVLGVDLVESGLIGGLCITWLVRLCSAAFRKVGWLWPSMNMMDI
jgi:hypothetical protein